MPSTYSGAYPQSRFASRLPRKSSFCRPCLIAATAREILRVTKVHGRPKRKNFCDTVRAARPERRLLGLRHLLRLAEHFAARSLIKTRSQFGFADGFQNANRADAGDIGSVLRNVEAHAHMALCTQMINFVRLQIVE